MFLAQTLTSKADHVNAPLWAWIAITAFVVIMLLFDLFFVNKEAHVITLKEAAFWSVVWIIIAIIFGIGLIFIYDGSVATKYFSGYLLEKSLSIDNLFVFALLFSYFKVPQKYQHRVLFWGIFGTLVLRGIFIFAGAALVEKFDFTLYIFGALLIYSGIKMAFADEDVNDMSENKVFKILKKIIPLTDEYNGQKFFTKINAKKFATPLFAVMIILMVTDVIFAVDSIPAIFGITTDPFLIMTSNAFAIMGLRALYFLLADLLDRFHYLQIGLAVLLIFIGAKLLLHTVIHINEVVALIIILVVLAISIVMSLLKEKNVEH